MPTAIVELLKDGANPCVGRVYGNGGKSVGGREGESGSIGKDLLGGDEEFVCCGRPPQADGPPAFVRHDHRVNRLRRSEQFFMKRL